MRRLWLPEPFEAPRTSASVTLTLHRGVISILLLQGNVAVQVLD